jgi:GNAT superfamily N-acetyltransferase
MKLTIEEATPHDVTEILALRLAIGAHMQERYGDDRWAPPIHEGSVLRYFKGPRTRKSDGETLIKILVGKIRGEIVALTRMQTKKPWAFDLKYFTPGAKAVYLGDVEVSAKCQGQGFGTQLMAAVVDHARVWPVGAVRTSSYDGAAGAGPFYAKCGFRETGRVTYRTIPMIYFEMIFGSGLIFPP